MTDDIIEAVQNYTAKKVGNDKYIYLTLVDCFEECHIVQHYLGNIGNINISYYNK